MIQIQPGGVENQGQDVPINGQEVPQIPRPEMPQGVNGVPSSQDKVPAPQGLNITSPTETAAPQPGGIPGEVKDPSEETTPTPNTIDASQPPSEAQPVSPDATAPMPGGDLTQETPQTASQVALETQPPVATPAPQPEISRSDPSENPELPPAEPPEIDADTDNVGDARGAVRTGDHNALERILQGNAETGNSQDASPAEPASEMAQSVQAPQPDQNEPVTPADKAEAAMNRGKGSGASETNPETFKKDDLGSDMTPEQHRSLVPENPETQEDRIVDRISELRKERDNLVRRRGDYESQINEVDVRIEEILNQYAQERESSQNSIEQGGGEK